MITLTKQQARQFILLKQGLLNEHQFTGRQGVLDFIGQAGCIQFDPVDVCGRSADIVLHSRVKGYKKEMLDELLYKERCLVDHFDKNLAIFASEDLPAFFYKKPAVEYVGEYNGRGGDAVQKIVPLIRQLIREHGHISAAEVGINETIEWYWNVKTSLPRAALESMYFSGELIIHHKTGTNKSYAFMKDHIPPEILDAAPPFTTEAERLAWHVRRRIGGVGMLWNKASDAWLGLNIKAEERAGAFVKLLEEGMIFGVMVEGIKEPLYIQEDDRAMLLMVLEGKNFLPRFEFIAPLDSLMWDRKLIKALFAFEYKWEIYTPAIKRKYGAYVLPVLCGEQFVGRIEIICDRKTKTLIIKNIWYEDSVKQTKKLQAGMDRCIKRFAKFSGCQNQIKL